jgi:hypothetical protein
MKGPPGKEAGRAANAARKGRQDSHSSPRSIGGDDRAPLRGDYFAPVPIRASEAFTAGAFPSGAIGFAVFAYLCAQAWQTGRVAEVTTGAIIAACGLAMTRQAVAKLLRRLAADGWIAFTVGERRSWDIEIPYIVRLRGGCQEVVRSDVDLDPGCRLDGWVSRLIRDDGDGARLSRGCQTAEGGCQTPKAANHDEECDCRECAPF